MRLFACFYRECARWIAERFGRLVLAASDGNELARLTDPMTGKSTDLPRPARRQRQAAAPYSLQQAIRWAFAKAGAEMVDAPAHDRSRRCPICSRRTDAPTRPGDLVVRCVEHGRWDQDHALAASLWRDDLADGERERWRWAMTVGRSRLRIIEIAG